MSDKKTYDLILFGVTGFTGKLAVEYLLKTYDHNAVSWAACARNATKAETILKELAESCNKPVPPLLTADLVCDDDTNNTSKQKEDTLRQVVRQTKIVLTCAGPFEKYGTTLVKLCAQEGVSYADITGETDFVRSMISEYDQVARDSGAIILSHCGNDCIPQDLTVFEMHQYAIQHNAKLKAVTTYAEFADTAQLSGGTAATAAFQLGKDRSKNHSKSSSSYDPLLQTKDGTKSEYATKNISPKSDIYEPNFGCKVGPWIMAPVMVNCVRRSNALLQYSKDFQYGDAQLKRTSWKRKLYEMTTAAKLAAAILVPPMKDFLLPQPGEGPDRETMEAGYLTLYGRGIMVVAVAATATATDDDGKKVEEEEEKEIHLETKFHFNKDIAYLYTASLLVETGMVLLKKKLVGGTITTTTDGGGGGGGGGGGVMTPAAALGSDLTKRILETMDASFELKAV